MNCHPLPVPSPCSTLAPRRLGLKANHGAVSTRLGKPLRLLAAAATLAASSTLCAAPAINVLTGGTSGVYYPIGVVLAQLYSDGITGAETTVRATKASVENLNLLQIGRGQLAFALGDSVAHAWQGVEDAGFRAPRDRLRAIASIYPNYIQIVASRESGIRTLADLKGKRISVGAPRSGTELNARAIFAAAGLSYADMGQVLFKPYAESVELIRNRELDATLQSAGLGMAAIRDLATVLPVTFVAIPAETVAGIGNSAYRAGVIPAGTYPGQEHSVPTATISNILVSQTSVSDELAYRMTRLLFENLDRLAHAHPAAKGIELEHAVEGLPIPLHPGAERFYREAGVLR